MIAFKVRLNYQLLAVAGAEDMSVLSAIMTASFNDGFPDGCHCRLHVGGLSRGDASGPAEHLEWAPHRNLAVGDFVSIEIVETDEASPIVERRPAERSPTIEDGEDVITLLSQEYLLLLHASQAEGIDLDGQEHIAVARARRLIELGLLVQRGENAVASDLGLEFLKHNKTEREFVHRHRVPRK